MSSPPGTRLLAPTTPRFRRTEVRQTFSKQNLRPIRSFALAVDSAQSFALWRVFPEKIHPKQKAFASNVWPVSGTAPQAPKVSPTKPFFRMCACWKKTSVSARLTVSFWQKARAEAMARSDCKIAGANGKVLKFIRMISFIRPFFGMRPPSLTGFLVTTRNPYGNFRTCFRRAF